MAVLIIIFLCVVLAARYSGRPVKLVLSDEEARLVKERWWAAARAELKGWTVFFAFGCAFCWNTLRESHWDWKLYAGLILGSLLLFSRLAIWTTLAVSVLVYALGFIYPGPATYGAYCFLACLGAIVLRFICLVMVKYQSANPVPPQDPPAPSPKKASKPVYDWQFDEYVYPEGNREPAFLRFKNYAERRKHHL